MKGMNKWQSPGQPLPASAPGPIVGNQWYMGPGDAANYRDLNVLQQHCIFLVGGGGACSEAPAGGGGGGGYGSGDPGDDGSSTWPFTGAAQGGQNSVEYGGRGGYGGACGTGDVGSGRPGIQMIGGWVGDIGHGGGPGGGGYWGGGEGGAQSGGGNCEVGETDSIFSFNFKVENIKILPGSYNVVVSQKLLSIFTHQDNNLKYYIALEPDSTFT